MQYFPMALPVLLFLLVVFVVVLILVEINVLKYAYQKMGIDQRYVFILLLLSLVGSQLQMIQLVEGDPLEFFHARRGDVGCVYITYSA